MSSATPGKTDRSLNLNAIQTDKLHEVCELFDRAEALAKRVEEFNRKVSIPALNELRYAGHHLVKALAPNGRDMDVELQRAADHCKRAVYDAGAAGLIVALERIDSFFENFQQVELASLLKDYSSLRQQVEAIRAQASAVRIDEENRSSDFDKLEKAFDMATLVVNELELVRDEANKALKKEKKSNQRFIITCSLTVFGIVVAIVLGVLSL